MPSRDLRVTLLGDDRTGPAFRSASGNAAGMMATFTRLGAMATAAVGVGLGAFAVKSAQAGVTFQATLNQMAAVADVPKSALADLSSLALKMGADTKFSAQQAADSMLNLAKGGLTAAQIQGGALEATLTLAAAGGLDLVASAGYMSNALNAFGLQAKDAGAVAAAFAGGANASTASVDSLGLALSQVGPGAVNAGLSLQQTVAVLAAFDNAGIKGSDAGTSLKTMLSRLVPTTAEAASAMQTLGLKFTDARGRFLPITEIAGQLQRALGNLSQEQRSAALATIFGSDATRAASVLMREGSAGLDLYIAKTSDLAAAQRVAKATMSGAGGALEQMRGSFETLATTIGLRLNPFVEVAALKVTAFLNAMTGMVPAAVAGLSMLQPVFAGIGQTVTGAVTVIGWLVERWQTVARVVAVVAAVMSPVILVLGAQMVALGVAATVSAARQVAAWTAAQVASGRNAVMMVFNSYRVVAGFAAMGAQAVVAGAVMVGSMAATVAATVSGWVLMGTQAMIQAARMAAAWLIALGPVGWVIAAVVAVVALVVANWDTVVNATKAAWSAVVGAVVAAWNWIGGAVGAAVNAVRGVIETVFGVIVTVVTTYVSIWRAVIETAWGVIQAVVGYAVDQVRGTISGLAAVGDWIGGFFGRARDMAAGALGGLVGIVAGIPGRIMGALGDLGGMLFDAGRRLIQGLIDGIMSMISKVGDVVGGVASKIRGFFPGSPVREGPLTAWNDGSPGRNLMGMLAGGVDAGAPDVARAIAAAADVSVAGPQIGSPVRISGSDAARSARDGGTVRLDDDQLDTLARKMAWALTDLQVTTVLDGRKVGQSVRRDLAWST